MASLRRLLIQAAVLALQEEENAEGTGIPIPQQQATSPSITDAIISWMKQTLTLFVIAIVFFITSLLTFALFYHLVMPPNVLIKPLYFDFSSNLQQWNTQSHDVPASRPAVVEEPDHHHNSIQGLYDIQAHPIARADLFWVHTQWQAYAPVAPSKRTTRILHPDQRYFIDVALTLPDSDINREIGVFMLEACLRDRNETLLAVSRRAAMLPFESPLVKITRKIVFLIPLLLGTVSEAQTVVLNLFDHFVENDEFSLASVETRIIVPKIRTYQQSLQIERAELRIGKELNTFQTLLKEWFYTCALAFTTLFMILQTLGLLWIWKCYHGNSKNSPSQFDHQHIPQQSNSYDESDDDHWSHISGTFSLVEDSASKDKLSDEDECSVDRNQDRSDAKAPIHVAAPILTEEDSVQTQSGADPASHASMNQQHNPSSHQGNEEDERRTKKKRNKVSSDKGEIRIKEEENERLRRVLEGNFERFQVFTGRFHSTKFMFQCI